MLPRLWSWASTLTRLGARRNRARLPKSSRLRKSCPLALEALEERTLLDTGLPASLAGRVFDDRNADGVQNGAEQGLQGWTVYLDRNANAQLDAGETTTLTDALGDWRFGDLQAGTHVVGLVPMPGFERTTAGSGTLRAYLADFNDALGKGSEEGFTSSGPLNQWHLSSGRRNDANHSALHSFYFGAGEGISGGGGYVSSANGTLTSPVIDLAGAAAPLTLQFKHFLRSETSFDFAEVRVRSGGVSNLLARSGGVLKHNTVGFETVNLDLSAYAGQQIQLEFKFTSDSIINDEGWYVDDVTILGSVQGAHVVELAAGQAATGRNFGARALAEIRGTVWGDVDGDGSRDPGDDGLPGVTVYLDANRNALRDAGERTAVTGTDGAYAFAGVSAGKYTVRLDLPAGHTQTFPPAIAETEYFRADFNTSTGASSADGFTVSGTLSQWRITGNRGSQAGHSSSFSAQFGTGGTSAGGGTYSGNANGTLQSPLIDLTNASGVIKLDFNHFLASESGFDYAEVRVLSGGVSTLLVRSGTNFPHDTNGFEHVTLDLSAFAGQQIRLQFKFTSDSIINEEGWYIDDVVVRELAGPGFHTVSVGPGDVASGRDFGKQALPDLIGASFEVLEGDALWGDEVTVQYTIRNQGLVAAGPFAARLYVSADSTITAADAVLDTLTFDGLAAGATIVGTRTVRLPGEFGLPPAGFTVPDDVFVGLLLDPAGAILEESEANNANRGDGLDRDPLHVPEPPPGEIRGTFWLDLDADGVRDQGEPGHAGVTVFLDLNANLRRDANEPIAVTDADGNYAFLDVKAGQYLVLGDLPSKFVRTFPAQSEPVVLLRADFTDDLGNPSAEGFTSSGALDQWHVSTRRGSQTGHSPTHSFYFGADEGLSAGFYLNNAGGTLLSPFIDLTGALGQVTLEFKHYLDAEQGYDFADVFVLENGTATRVATSRDGGTLPSFTNGFQAVSLDLSAFAGKRIQLQFRFSSDFTVTREGWYVDDVTVRAASVAGTHMVLVLPEKVTTGVDFGNRPPPDLAGVSFAVDETGVFWGDEVTVRYTVENRGLVASGPFTLSLRVSADAIVTAADPLVANLLIDDLGAGQRRSDVVTVRLPGSPGSPPAGFAEPQTVFVGMILDPANALVEDDETNNANLGAGIDRDSLTVLLPPPGEVRGFVFEDADGDGVRDPDERGLADLTVYLDVDKNNLRDLTDPFTITDADGFYQFDNLRPGTYRVGQVLPVGQVQVVPGLPLYRATFSDENGRAVTEGYAHSGATPWFATANRGSTPGHSPDHSIRFGSGGTLNGGGTYPNGANTILSSPVIDLTGVTGPVFLDFNHFADVEPGADFIAVGIRADGVDTFLADSGSSLGGLPGKTTAFQPVSLDVSSYAGKKIQVRFRFTSDSTGTGEGWYVDDVVIRTPGRGGLHEVQVAPGATVEGVSFGNRLAPDLVSTRFRVVEADALWGDTVNVEYTITNRSAVDAGPFAVDVFVNRTNIIEPVTFSKLFLKRLEFDGLAAGATISDTIQVTLPGAPGAPPTTQTGYVEPQLVFLGTIVDALNQVPETNELNNFRLGEGLDRDPLQILRPPAQVRGVVWNDLDADGQRDDGEEGLAGVTVYLDRNGNLTPDGNEEQAVTDADGVYQFNRLPAGTYTVRVVTPANYAATFPPPTLGREIYRADFESAEGTGSTMGFVTAGAASEWHLSDGRGLDDGRSPAHGFYFGLDETPDGGGQYSASRSGTLTSPVIDLTDASGVLRLEFNHFLLSEESFDFAEVRILSGGVTTTLVRSGSTFPHDTNGFEHVSLDVSAFAGKKIQVQFSFSSDSIIEEEGWYVDDVVVRELPAPGSHRVSVALGQMVEGIDFALQPFPDLAVTAFDLVEESGRWGEDVTVHYTIANLGGAPTGAFQATLYLSADGVIAADDVALAVVDVPGLGAFGSRTGTVVVRLPGSPLQAPDGFTLPALVHLGFVTDPTDAVAEGTEGNNANRGNGIDRAPLQVLFPPSAIEGRVWSDLDRDGQLDGGESGLAGVTVYLDLNADNFRQPGEPVAVTRPGGEYRFEGLQPANWKVSLVTPPQHALVTPQPSVVLLQAGFNGGGDGRFDAGGFTSSGQPGDLWHLSIGAGSITDAAFYFGQGEAPGVPGRYTANASGALTSPVLDLRGLTGSVTLSFSHLLEVEDGFDFASVRVLAGGQTFVLANNGAVGGLPAVTQGVERAVVDLSAFVGQQIQIQFHFQADGSEHFQGWYIDDLLVFGSGQEGSHRVALGPDAVEGGRDFVVRPLPDLAGDGFTMGPSDLAWGDLTTVRFAVVNRGIAASAATRVELRLSTDNAFDGSDVLLAGPDGKPATIDLPALAPGERFEATALVRLPAVPPSGLGNLDQLFVGLRIDPTNDVPEASEANNQGVGAGRDWAAAQMLTPRLEDEGNNSPQDADDLPLIGRVDGGLTAGDADVFRVTVALAGRLTAMVHAQGVDTRLSLFRDDGLLLIESVGQFNPLTPNPSPPGGEGSETDDLIAQHLLPGTYFLAVRADTAGTGAYSLTTRFELATPPFGEVPVGDDPSALVTGDLDRDGRLDLVVANQRDNSLTVLRGTGDGTFAETGPRLLPGLSPSALALADFDADGRLDLAVTLAGQAQVVILRGGPDGTFVFGGVVDRYTVGASPRSLVTGDFNGDGNIDLAVTCADSDEVAVLLGRGDGSFVALPRFTVGDAPTLIVQGDADLDGDLDLVVAHAGSRDIRLFLGRGDGSFTPFPRTLFLASAPQSMTIGDVNGDGRPDLFVTIDATGPNLVVVLNETTGYRSLAAQSIRERARGLVTADFNGDGLLDLASANFFSADVALALGDGTGTFRAVATTFAVGQFPVALVAGDFNGDSRLDLATANSFNDNVSILLGVRDGVFPTAGVRFTVGDGPRDLVAADFNADGQLDLATANGISNDVSILLRRGEGSFAPVPARPGVGMRPVAIVQGDFNGDGRPDLATADQAGDTVSILLGLGDGTFAAGQRLSVGDYPTELVAGDFNGDGTLDLVTSNHLSKSLTVLLGRGDGTFADAGFPFFLRRAPWRMTAGDFNNDGRLDLVTFDPFFYDLTVLLGRGNGAFTDIGVRIPTRNFVDALLAGDFNNDGKLDLVTANRDSSRSVTVFTGTGVGTFLDTGVNHPAGFGPTGLAAGDFNADGNLDLVVADGNSNVVALLPGTGAGGFGVRSFVAVGLSPSSVVATDFNGDGRLDLAAANSLTNDVDVFNGRGDGQFQGDSLFADRIYAAPVLADFNADGVTDAAVLNTRGELLLRLGRSDVAGAFEAPRLVDPDGTARALTAVRGPGGLVRLASLEKASDAVLVYTLGPDGNMLGSLRLALPGVFQPVQLSSADLDGDGLGDLVISNSGGTNLKVFLGVPGGGFTALAAPHGFKTGLGPGDLRLADVDGNGTVDIVVANQIAGDVSVFLNRGGARFEADRRFRAGEGLHGLFITPTGLREVRSGQRTVGIELGDFTGDGLPDVVAANASTGTFSLLPGKHGGSLLAPRVTFSGKQAGAVRAGFFNADALLDLAVLNDGEGTVDIYLGDGRGGFGKVFTADAGLNPLGLTVVDANGDGKNDLLIGNDYGDLLTVLGNGDGTFQAFTRSGRSVPFVTEDFNGDGLLDVLLTNEARDEVRILFRVPGTDQFTPGTFDADRSAGLLGPIAPTLVDLNGDGKNDILLANSASNTLSAYLTQANGTLRAVTVFAGTNPAALTVQDLNSDGVLDVVVANRGSNDVSVLFGQGEGDDWRLIPGPRIRAGRGPVAVTAEDRTDDGLLDLVVINGQEGTVSILPGIGSGGKNTGFFNDTQATLLALPIDPGSSAPPIIALPPVGGFLVTATGSVIQLATMSVVFTPQAGQAVRFVTPFLFAGSAAPDLFAVREDGNISRLTMDADGQYAEAQVLRDSALTDPSFLRVVQQGDQIEIYAANAGDGLMVVLGLSVGLGPSGPALPDGLVPTAGEALTSTLTTLTENPAALVATLGLRLPLEEGESGAARDQAAALAELGAADFVPGLTLRQSDTTESGTEAELLPSSVGLPLVLEILREMLPTLTATAGATEAVLTKITVGLLASLTDQVEAALGAVGEEVLEKLSVPRVVGNVADDLAELGRGALKDLQKQIEEKIEKAAKEAVEAPPAEGEKKEEENGESKKEEEGEGAPAAPAEGKKEQVEEEMGALGPVAVSAFFAALPFYAPVRRKRRRTAGPVPGLRVEQVW